MNLLVLLGAMILALMGCRERRIWQIDNPVTHYQEGAVHYANPPYPIVVLTFAPNVLHIEPADGDEIAHANVMCRYFFGPKSYPIRMHKKKVREYLTVCSDITYPDEGRLGQ